MILYDDNDKKQGGEQSYEIGSVTLFRGSGRVSFL